MSLGSFTAQPLTYTSGVIYRQQITNAHTCGVKREVEGRTTPERAHTMRNATSLAYTQPADKQQTESNLCQSVATNHPFDHPFCHVFCQLSIPRTSPAQNL